MKTHWQNQLKFSVLVWFQILYRIRYKKIDVILAQCPFKYHPKNICISALKCHPLIKLDIKSIILGLPRTVKNISHQGNRLPQNTLRIMRTLCNVLMEHVLLITCQQHVPKIFLNCWIYLLSIALLFHKLFILFLQKSAWTLLLLPITFLCAAQFCKTVIPPHHIKLSQLLGGEGSKITKRDSVWRIFIDAIVPFHLGELKEWMLGVTIIPLLLPPPLPRPQRSRSGADPGIGRSGPSPPFDS